MSAPAKWVRGDGGVRWQPTVNGTPVWLRFSPPNWWPVISSVRPNNGEYEPLIPAEPFVHRYRWRARIYGWTSERLIARNRRQRDRAEAKARARKLTRP